MPDIVGDGDNLGDHIATKGFKQIKGGDIASADAITLGTDGNTFDITGTTTVNHFNTTNWAVGSVVVLHFDGALTLTHNAGSLSGAEANILLSGDSNHTTTAGDILTFVLHDSTTWQEIARNSGTIDAIGDIGDVTITSASEHQMLLYNGSNWYNNSPDKLIYVCKNATASTIGAGKIVYVSGFHTASSTVEIELADNSSASTMPAFGFTMESITAGSTGKVLQQGQLESLNTDGIAEGTVLYVGTSGNWSTTKPTGTALIQNIGKVLRDNASSGIIHVGGSGRSNDVPNIADGNIWIGNSSAVPTAVTPSGDATITNAGVISVSDLTISGETSQDLLYYNGSNWVRLAKGTDGQVLKTDSGSLAWGSGGGGATIVHTYTNTTNTSYLGTASSFGTVGVGDRDIYIKKIDSNNEGVYTKIWKNGSAVEVQIA